MSPHIQLSRLGLKAQPHVGDNVIHGSASPLEADSKRSKICGGGFRELRKITSGLDREDDLARRWICQRRLWEAAERARPKPAKVAPLKALNFLLFWFSFGLILFIFVFN